jgi:hypothetical protein
MTSAVPSVNASDLSRTYFLLQGETFHVKNNGSLPLVSRSFGNSW